MLSMFGRGVLGRGLPTADRASSRSVSASRWSSSALAAKLSRIARMSAASFKTRFGLGDHFRFFIPSSGV